MSHQAETVLVIGHRGRVGRALMDQLGRDAVGVGRAECDIVKPEMVERVLALSRPTTIVNCAGYTDVDLAETEPERARLLNAEAVQWLGRMAWRRGIHFITLSSDYVFNGRGDQPFRENADPEDFGPVCVYGQTKLEGERRLKEIGGASCVVRTQWLYGAGSRNFIDTIAGLAATRPVLRVVEDQVGAPTWTRDLAAGIALLIHRGAMGIFHVVNSGFVSRADVARAIVERMRLHCRIEPIGSDELPRPAARPKNCRLSQQKFAELNGAPLRLWIEALNEYLTTKGTG